MSDKALKPQLTDGELELTQKMQIHFPRGRISVDRIQHWSSCPVEELTERLEKALQQPTFEVAPEYLPIWRKFRVGGLDKIQIRTELKKVGRKLSDWGDKLFESEEHKVSLTPSDTFFARVNLSFLGFKKSPCTKDWLTAEFFAGWSKKHLRDGWVMELCEREDGPSIGYQYTTQPNGEVLWVAHKPVVVVGDAHVWRVVRGVDGRLWLHADCANPAREWALDDEMLLRLRKIQSSVA